MYSTWVALTGLTDVQLYVSPTCSGYVVLRQHLVSLLHYLSFCIISRGLGYYAAGNLEITVVRECRVKKEKGERRSGKEGKDKVREVLT